MSYFVDNRWSRLLQRELTPQMAESGERSAARTSLARQRKAIKAGHSRGCSSDPVVKENTTLKLKAYHANRRPGHIKLAPIQPFKVKE